MFVYGLFSLFFWVLLIMGVFALVRSFAGGDRQTLPPHPGYPVPGPYGPPGPAPGPRPDLARADPRRAVRPRRDRRGRVLAADHHAARGTAGRPHSRAGSLKSPSGPAELDEAPPLVPEERHQPGRAVV